MKQILESLQIVAQKLEDIGIPYVFLGGGVICLLVDDAMEFFPKSKRHPLKCAIL